MRQSPTTNVVSITSQCCPRGRGCDACCRGLRRDADRGGLRRGSAIAVHVHGARSTAILGCVSRTGHTAIRETWEWTSVGVRVAAVALVRILNSCESIASGLACLDTQSDSHGSSSSRNVDCIGQSSRSDVVGIAAF